LRLIVSGGGTGGHIYPALAIARAVKEADASAEVLYVGTRTGLEASLVPKEGLPFEAIPARGLMRRGLLRAPGSILMALRGVAAARRAIRRFKPDVVVGTGGYVSGPVALAARLEGVPLVLHEQNVYPGATNRLASRWAAVVAVPYAEVARHFPKRTRVVVTGNPVRRAVLETTPEQGRRVLGLPLDGRLVYVTGGSQGARVLNEHVVAALPAWLAIPGVSVVFATGARYHEAIVEALVGRGLPVVSDLPGESAAGPGRPVGRGPAAGEGGKLVVLPYLERADAALAAADVMVTRGGATTLAEVTARGVPAVIIPSPNVAHNEQEFNARVLGRAGAARVVLESELAGGRGLEEAVSAILSDDGLRLGMRRASLSLGRPEASSELAKLVLAAARRGRRRAGGAAGPEADSPSVN